MHGVYGQSGRMRSCFGGLSLWAGMRSRPGPTGHHAGRGAVVGRETLDAGDRLVRHLVSLRQADPPSAHAVPLADCWHRRPSVVLVVYRVVGVLVPSADSAGRGRFP